MAEHIGGKGLDVLRNHVGAPGKERLAFRGERKGNRGSRRGAELKQVVQFVKLYAILAGGKFRAPFRTCRADDIEIFSSM